MEMPFVHRTWDMCKAEVKEKQRICADKADLMVHQGLCTLPIGLPSQPATDVCLEDDGFQHGISRGRQGSSLANCLRLSDQSCSVARQERPSLTFPDLKKSAPKVSFASENSRTSSFPSPYSSTLSVVSEDKPWDNSSSMCNSWLQDDGSSISSLSSSEENSSCSSEDVSEVQSSYKGPLANMCSLEDALPRKRGLSGFFAGKSKSFGCLADAASVEDLAKPENVYAKRRKYISACIGNADRPRILPIRSGASGISKKSFRNSKYSIALAVTLSAEEDQPEVELDCPSRFVRNLAASRSYSLSDLQGAGFRCSHQ
eukprot:c17260_g1_i1 orf=432-1376(+)